MNRTMTLTIALTAGSAGIAWGQAEDPCFNINLMAEAPQYAGCSVSTMYLEPLEVCENLVFEPWPPTLLFVHVMVSRDPDLGDGIGGAQFGIEYVQDVQGWTLCGGGAEIPQEGWPDSGTGNAVAFAGGCYQPMGSVTTAGFFSIQNGSEGTFQVTSDPRIGQVLWADCETTLFEVPPENLGHVDLAEGFSPTCADCGPTPTRETSWARLKSMY